MRGYRIFLFTLFLVLIISAIYFYFIYFSNYLVLGIGLNNNTNWTSNLSRIFHGSLAFGDIDNDGDLDLIGMGCSVGGVDTCTTADKIRVYTNSGSSFTENQTWEENLTLLGYGSLAFGDIDNDGDLDLLALGDKGGGNGDVKIYTNNGTSFNENLTWETNLSNIDAYASSIVLGDIDNDGRLDLALLGAFPSSNNGVYINNGTSFIKNSSWLESLPLVGHGLGIGALTLGDIYNDGNLDLVFAGSYSTNFYSKIYLNNGTSLIENSTWRGDFTAYFGWPSIIFGDFDNDNDLDLVAIGTRSGDHIRIYENNRSSFLLKQENNATNTLIGIFDGSIAFGDIDNDGDLDLGAMGKESGRNHIYNNTNNLFEKDAIAEIDMKLDNLQQGSLAFGDIDNDGDLDLAINGKQDDLSTYFFNVYINNNTINNTIPAPPNSSFSSSYANNQLTLRWGNGSDNKTPTAGLYYNLRVGTTSGGNQIVSGVYGGSSNPTAGYFGNMMQRKSITLHGSWLQASTTYYWSVQTIDTGLAKSNWSAEQTFSTAADITSPAIAINFPEDNNYTSFSNITFSANISDNVAVSNVSLYGSWINWHRNQTDSSGLNGTEYLFQINLSAYGEGSFTWAIQACDTTNNCIFSSNRTVIRDLSYPLVYLESPANSSSWTDNNSVTFSFNVTDFAIANCSLIVGSSLQYNFTSVTVNTSTSATVTLDNGNYNWSVNCTDMLLRQNSSARRQISVNYQAPAAPSGALGSGGGGGILTTTYSVGELKEAQEINKELGKGDKIKFNLTGEEHKLELKKITSENATIEINSTAFNFTLAINESRKFNLSSEEFYDLLVKLNNIKLFKANLTLIAIHEAIYVKTVEEKPIKPVENVTEEKEEEKPIEKERENQRRDYWWVALVILILFILTIIIWTKRKKKWLS